MTTPVVTPGSPSVARTVLVTGAGGFLGRHLVTALAAAGWAPVPLGRRAADVADRAALLAHAQPAAAVVHLAFPTVAEDRRGEPLAALSTAAAGLSNALSLAERASAERFVLASSGKVYGLPESLPIAEDHPLRPNTWLGTLKLTQETLLEIAARRAGLRATSLRIFNAYGPRQREGFLVPRLLDRWRRPEPLALGELDHARDWVHVDDVCAAFLTALTAPETAVPASAATALNVGSGRAATVRDLLTHLAAITGHRPTITQRPERGRPDEAPEERADITRLRALGWSPRVELQDGLRRCWESVW